MRKLLLKILLLVFIIFILNRITYMLLDAPFYWQNNVAVEKEMIFKKNRKDFNAVFLGSSRTYRQIDPQLFDSLTASTGSKSFNYGIQNLFAPYTHLIAYDLLQKKDPEFEVLFIELTKPLYFLNNIAKPLNWEDIHQEVAILNTLMRDQDHQLYFKLQKGAVHVYNAINKASNANLLDYHFDKDRFANPNLVPENGFLSLDAENKIRPEVKQRNEIFLSDTSKIIPFNKETASVFKDLYQYKNYNKHYLNGLKKLIKTAEAKNVHIYFFLPIRFIDNEASEVVSVFNGLPEANKLKVAVNEDFEKLYLVENNWDRGHLNENGAQIFTKLLAEAYLEKVEKLAAIK